jgi:signal transduction histidine kinase
VKLALEIKYDAGLAMNLGSLGFCYLNVDNSKALEFTKKALFIRKKIGDQLGISNSLNVLGVINYYIGNYQISLEYLLESLKIREKIGNADALAISYNNISLVHIAVRDFPSALESLNKAMALHVKLGDVNGISIVKDNMGKVYFELGKYDLAFKYYIEALELNKKLGNHKSEASLYNDLAAVYWRKKDFGNAVKNYQIAHAIYTDLKEKNGIANAEIGIALIDDEEGKVELAIKHAKNALENSQEIPSLDNICRSADILQKSYFKLGEYKKAYNYLLIYKNANSKLNTNETIKRLTKNEFDFKIDKMKKEQEAAISRQKFYIYSLVVTLTLVLIIVILMVRNSKNKKRTNAKLNALNEKLKESNSAKDKFFSIIAHDLRGPFMALLGSSDILANEVYGLTSDEIKSLGQGLHLSIKMQYDLLNDLLDWSRIQTGNFELEPKCFALWTIIDEVLASLSLSLSQKNIIVKNEIKKELKISADLSMISLVVRNLISNGIKFTPLDGRISVSAKENESMVEIIIQDNGVGIEKEDLDKLFKIDVHHSTKGTSGEMGTGLGLVLCKEIIELHGGQISAESEPGKGSSFIFTLPR